MQIVIDISSDDFRKVQDGRASVSMMRKAIRNGTPIESYKAETETCNGIHAQVTAQKGTFDRIYNDNDTEDDGI